MAKSKSKIHWYYGCVRGHSFNPSISAFTFASDVSDNPDWFCVTCATKARLALAAESAPKPSDVVWPTPRPISEARETEILGYCPDIGWRRLSQMGQRWALTGAEHIADYEPTHFLPLPPEVIVLGPITSWGSVDSCPMCFSHHLSDRYAELRKLVEAWIDGEPGDDTEDALLNWSHR